jgi:hypothetical protein
LGRDFLLDEGRRILRRLQHQRQGTHQEIAHYLPPGSASARKRAVAAFNSMSRAASAT